MEYPCTAVTGYTQATSRTLDGLSLTLVSCAVTVVAVYTMLIPPRSYRPTSYWYNIYIYISVLPSNYSLVLLAIYYRVRLLLPVLLSYLKADGSQCVDMVCRYTLFGGSIVVSIYQVAQRRRDVDWSHFMFYRLVHSGTDHGFSELNIITTGSWWIVYHLLCQEE